jgi:RNA-directed DNA polymerase
MTIEAFPAFKQAHWSRIAEAIREGNYRPAPVRRAWISKPDGSKRPLGIPVLEDKIVQQAVKMILEPIWENDFADESIGYRPGRGARKATQELSEALYDGKHRWVVEADIRGFLDRSSYCTGVHGLSSNSSG